MSNLLNNTTTINDLIGAINSLPDYIDPDTAPLSEDVIAALTDKGVELNGDETASALAGLIEGIASGVDVTNSLVTLSAFYEASDAYDVTVTVAYTKCENGVITSETYDMEVNGNLGGEYQFECINGSIVALYVIDVQNGAVCIKEIENYQATPIVQSTESVSVVIEDDDGGGCQITLRLDNEYSTTV